jgi:hypothetical protein
MGAGFSSSGRHAATVRPLHRSRTDAGADLYRYASAGATTRSLLLVAPLAGPAGGLRSRAAYRVRSRTAGGSSCHCSRPAASGCGSTPPHNATAHVTNSTQRQLVMPELTDSEMLDRLIACILSMPNGLGRIDRVHCKMIENGDYPSHLSINAQSAAITTAPIIRARLEQSRHRMLDDLGCEELELAVIRNWYFRNFELLPGDVETVSEGTNRKSPRWWRTLSNAVKGCNALKRVDRDRYLIV